MEYGLRVVRWPVDSPCTSYKAFSACFVALSGGPKKDHERLLRLVSAALGLGFGPIEPVLKAATGGL